MKDLQGLCAGGPVLSSPHQVGEILRVGLNVPHKLGWEEPLDSFVGWLSLTGSRLDLPFSNLQSRVSCQPTGHLCAS